MYKKKKKSAYESQYFSKCSYTKMKTLRSVPKGKISILKAYAVIHKIKDRKKGENF